MSLHGSPATRTNSLSVQLTLVVTAIVLVAVGLVCVFGFWTMQRIDGDAADRQRGFVSQWIAGEVETQPQQQRSITVWDDAVQHARSEDQVWLDENLGIWMNEYFGHDEVFILRPDDTILYAMQDGKTVAPQSAALDAPVAKLVAGLRADMSAASTGEADSTAAIAALQASDIVVLADGSIVVASAVPIIPSSSRVTQASGTERLHVAVQRIDAALLDRLAVQYDLNAVRLSGHALLTGQDTEAPIVDASGRTLGAIVWKGYRPGLSMVRDVGPAFGVAVVIGLSVVFWLLGRLRRSSTELQVSEAQAQFLAFHDVLTGLPNRALFEDRLERALVQARRDDRKVALHYLDLDRFKNVNDTLGHAAGDELVRQVATRLQAAVRETDTVARLGGDEFAIVQVSIRSDVEAENLARRILQDFARPFDLEGETAVVGGSVGIVLSYGDSTRSDELMRKADIALYEAKNRGRGRYQVFAGDMDELVRRRRMIERELREALTTNTQLNVVYQPVFGPDGTTILGAEALVRWNHPIHGVLSPEVFIGIAEERGLIEPLGEFVLERACKVAAELDLPWVAVNISPLQIRNEQFAARVLAIVGKSALPPKRLQLEITEGLFLENTKLTERTLATLRGAGIRVALDDFGTGYSSMSYLRKYAIDKLKIDRSFINQLGTTPDADAIVRAMITLARSMHIDVTAEGVETREQLLHLAAIGCHEFQGYLMSRPISSAEVAKMMQPDELGDPLAATA